MFDTPWVSTPRRSVIVSTSAASAASSLLTPSFSKISVTVRRSAASETKTWSFVGTLKRSRIMACSSRRDGSRFHSHPRTSRRERRWLVAVAPPGRALYSRCRRIGRGPTIDPPQGGTDNAVHPSEPSRSAEGSVGPYRRLRRNEQCPVPRPRAGRRHAGPFANRRCAEAGHRRQGGARRGGHGGNR